MSVGKKKNVNKVTMQNFNLITKELFHNLKKY